MNPIAISDFDSSRGLVGRRFVCYDGVEATISHPSSIGSCRYCCGRCHVYWYRIGDEKFAEHVISTCGFKRLIND